MDWKRELESLKKAKEKRRIVRVDCFDVRLPMTIEEEFAESTKELLRRCGIAEEEPIDIESKDKQYIEKSEVKGIITDIKDSCIMIYLGGYMMPTGQYMWAEKEQPFISYSSLIGRIVYKDNVIYYNPDATLDLRIKHVSKLSELLENKFGKQEWIDKYISRLKANRSEYHPMFFK